MEIKVRGIKDAGKAQDERVIIEVCQDINIGNFVSCFVRDIDENVFSTKMISPIWFPDLNVKSGDLVVVYTRPGTRSKKILDSGASVHFFYRGSDSPLCGDAGIAVINLKISDWLYSKLRI